MFPISLEVVIVGLAEFVVIGTLIGILTGSLVSLILKIGVRGIAKDGLLGLTGFLITLSVWSLVPLPYPFIAATTVAAALPASHQFFRFERLKSEQ